MLEALSLLLDPRGVVVHDDGFPFAVDVERLGPGLAEPVARVLDAAKRHVRPGAIGRSVDRHEPRAVARDELLDPVAVERVNGAGQSEAGRVGDGNRLLEIRHRRAEPGITLAAHQGQAFQIVRPKGDLKGVHRQKKGFLGTYVQDIGQLEVTKVLERTSVAQITFSCDMILLGDLLVDIPDRVSPLQRSETTLDKFADPSGKQTGRLMMSRDGHETLTKNAVVYIDLGSEDKVKPGDYLTVYRKRMKGDLTSIDNEENARGRATGFQSDRYHGGGYSIQAQRAKDSTGFVNSKGRYRYKPITTKQIRRDRPALPRKIVGEMVIIDVQARTATAIITRVVQEVHTGDWVEVQ